jgi:hypothetical protein
VENNKEVGKSIPYDYKIYIRNGQEITSNPQNFSDTLNYFLVVTVDIALNLNKCANVTAKKLIIVHTPYLFILSLIMSHSVTQSLKVISSTGFEKIPKCLVIQCIIISKN